MIIATLIVIGYIIGVYGFIYWWTKDDDINKSAIVIFTEAKVNSYGVLKNIENNIEVIQNARTEKI